MMEDEHVNGAEAVYNLPLLVLDISKVEGDRYSKDRSRSEERSAFRLHVVFGKDHGVIDFHRKKNWVFDSELQISTSKYLELMRLFKDSLEGLENKPKFVTFASKHFRFSNINF